MQKIETFNKQNLGDLRKGIDQLLKEFTEKYGLGSAKIGTIRFDSGSFRTKLEVKTKGTTRIVTKMTTSINPIKIGDKFHQGRTTYTVVKTDNPGKFQYSVVTQNDKRYKIKADTLINMTKIK